MLREPRSVPQPSAAASSPPQPFRETVGECEGLDLLDDAVCLHDLAVSRRAVGLYHPDVANVLNTLAGLYVELGDYTEAERLANDPWR